MHGICFAVFDHWITERMDILHKRRDNILKNNRTLIISNLNKVLNHIITNSKHNWTSEIKIV